jgi:hypothetical protein
MGVRMRTRVFSILQTLSRLPYPAALNRTNTVFCRLADADHAVLCEGGFFFFRGAHRIKRR